MQNKNLRKKNADASNAAKSLAQFAGLGKLPPQALELEEAVLGAMMLEGESVARMVGNIKPEYFYRPEHQLIVDTIFSLFAENKPVDITTVTHGLRSQNQLEMAGGPGFIAMLTSRVLSSANIEYHARIIHQKWVARQIIVMASEAIEKAYEESTMPFELADDLSARYSDITDIEHVRGIKKAGQIAYDRLTSIRQSMDDPRHTPGIPTGFKKVDREIGGWSSPDLIVVAARPGMGKTAFALKTALAGAYAHHVLFFSLEMSAEQLVNRLQSMISGVNSHDIYRGHINEDQWTKIQQSSSAIDRHKLYIDDTGGITMEAMRARARKMKQQHGLSLIVVDYLQIIGQADASLLRDPTNSITMISGALKRMAKDLEVPVIVLSQLSREVETQKDGSKKPKLHHLRQSGAIEQDADIVAPFCVP